MSGQDSTIDDRPLYSARRRRVLRTFVIIAVVAMLLPVLANFVAVSSTTASTACARAVAYSVPDATGSAANFQLFGEGGIGWQCYSVGGFGGGRFVVPLGIIPGEVYLPNGTRT